MAITLNTAFAKYESPAPNVTGVLTLANVVVASGSNRCLVVPFVAYDSGNNTRTYTATYGGVSMTNAKMLGPGGTAPDNDQIGCFVLAAPAVGTADVVITQNAGNYTYLCMGAGTFDGVDQSTIYRTAGTGTGSGTTASATATTTSGDLVLGVHGVYIGTNYTGLGSDTVAFEEENNAANDSIFVNYKTASGSSTALSATFSTSGTWWSFALPLIQAGASVPTISGIVPTVLSDGLVGIVITGTNFGASQGAGTVKISPTDNVADGGAISQTVTAWADTSITITASRSTLSQNANLYAFVTNNGGSSNSSGSIVQFGVLRSTRLYGVQGSLKTIVTL